MNKVLLTLWVLFTPLMFSPVAAAALAGFEQALASADDEFNVDNKMIVNKRTKMGQLTTCIGHYRKMKNVRFAACLSINIRIGRSGCKWVKKCIILMVSKT
ncbi:hypothetical protein [Moritella yayanosii]|uniref:Uncharacterized protein n=1 Tax=Moritella yayanosii TaxID=69539 RepID=A0A330LJ34_9GAMM|nr:hypothetical protein [Moritella yayanosii]SQD76683.1 exported protein of unknown function [Moritella yayanosii]